jgi:hypothetical protein
MVDIPQNRRGFCFSGLLFCPSFPQLIFFWHQGVIFHRPVQAVICPLEAQQLGVSAAFHDLSFLQNQYLIGVLNRTQAMCDHQAGASLRKIV